MLSPKKGRGQWVHAETDIGAFSEIPIAAPLPEEPGRSEARWTPPSSLSL
tara:strand:- start:509 stop:658 length:150 start_codon:yes stop_codon:yes gene_type:complete